MTDMDIGQAYVFFKLFVPRIPSHYFPDFPSLLATFRGLELTMRNKINFLLEGYV
jgi:hypothetical protein